ncbi:MAG TPA: hypothetical protein VJS69_02215, partial [Candidatus Krumholzibacteria bacterium]|nr:hypothetical protein [Candidatus Krumholzibacteria bacterium]
YPLKGGLAGGVELKPSGTIFAAPVTLTIETTKTPDAGEVPVAILFEGDATKFEPSLVKFSGGKLSIPMTHFSGGTGGFATAQELDALTSSQGVNCLTPALAQMAANDQAGAETTFHSCFTSDVLPALQNATNDVQLATAIGTYTMWKDDARLVLAMAPFDDAAEVTQWKDALVGKLRDAIDRDNQACEDNQSLAQLANVLFWQTQATRFGIDTVPNLLNRDHVLSSLCAHAVVDEIVVPHNLQIGFPHSFDIQFGLLFTGHAESQGVPFDVQLTGQGVDIQHPNGFTDAQGKYTTVITANADSVVIFAHACLIAPGTTTPTDVCTDGQGASNGRNLSGTWGGSMSGTRTGSVHFHFTQNQNAIIAQGNFCGQSAGSLHIGATLSGTGLLNASLTTGGTFCPTNLKDAAQATLGGCLLNNGNGTVADDFDHITLQFAGACSGCGDVTITLTLTRDADPCPGQP